MAEKVAVVGAGIMGIANAWREAVRGAEVTLFERNPRARDASVRNFGMVWPIGQPSSRWDLAMLSRGLWDEFVGQTGAWCDPSGSQFVAKREDEWRVMQEFAASSSQMGYQCEVLGPEASIERCPAITKESLFGSLYSATEMGVDPREVLSIAPKWLEQQYNVQLEFNTTIVDIDMPQVRSADGRVWEFDRVTVASGADFETLYPELFASQDLTKCKLQMMRTIAQPNGWRVGPRIASGLTLRHYPAFSFCEDLEALSNRIAEETPELDRYGIHVMAGQNGAGEMVLGDSHEYGDDITPFDNEEITGLILRELRKLIDLPDWSLTARWHGVYPVNPTREVEFIEQPAAGVTVHVATCGCGMTLGFGFAERRVAALKHSNSASETISLSTAGISQGGAPS